MPKVNPNILRWARETAGITPEEAVKRLNINEVGGVSPIERLKDLEEGKKIPTRSMLVKMAKHYRRPLLTFYLSDRPRIGDRGRDYRKLPETIDHSDNVLVDIVIRKIYARQSLVRAMLIEEDEAKPLTFIGSSEMKEGVKTVVHSIRKHMSFDLEEYRHKAGIEGAFSYLRGQAEKAGIFVILVDNLGNYYTTINVDAFRGFALADDIAPFIAINANDSKGALCFTLIHELAHLWLGASGVSGEFAVKSIEKFCNDVASEFLLPEVVLKDIELDKQTDIADAKEQISVLGRTHNVSSTMVAYKLYRIGRFDYDHYEKLRKTFRQDFLDSKACERAKRREQEKNVGPSYYNLQKRKVGEALVHLVDRMMYSGALSTTKAGIVLGVKAKNVQGVIEAARPVHVI